MSLSFIREYDSNHNLYQVNRADGVTPLVGGQVIAPKVGVRIRGKKGLSHLHVGEDNCLNSTNPRFLPNEKPTYNVNDPGAGWVSYSSTRRGGFRPYNLRKGDH